MFDVKALAAFDDFITILTLEFLSFFVQIVNMSLQIPFGGERAIADTTFVLLDPLVDAFDVGSVIMVAFEGSLADNAPNISMFFLYYWIPFTISRNIRENFFWAF